MLFVVRLRRLGECQCLSGGQPLRGAFGMAGIERVDLVAELMVCLLSEGANDRRRGDRPDGS